MEMEKSFYVVTFRPAYVQLVQSRSGSLADEAEDVARQRIIVALTQGGFGQDVVDDERQAKERFLEYLFFSSDLDLPRTAEVFDDYFELEQATEFINLDEELEIALPRCSLQITSKKLKLCRAYLCLMISGAIFFAIVFSQTLLSRIQKILIGKGSTTLRGEKCKDIQSVS